MEQVIATDMDGTFLDDAGSFDEVDFQQQLDVMAEKRIHFVAASSNSYPNLLNTLASVNGPISYVCNNGSQVVDERGVIIAEEVIDHLVLQKALDWFKAETEFAPAEIILAGKNGAYCNLPADSERFIASKYFYANLQSQPDLRLVFDDIYKIDVTWEKGPVIPKQAKFNQHFRGRLAATSSGMNGLDISVAGINKLTGVQKLLAGWHLTEADVIAFGDNGNDFELINGVKRGYAMKNAAPDLLAKVSDVTDFTNHDHGVQRMIAELLN